MENISLGSLRGFCDSPALSGGRAVSAALGQRAGERESASGRGDGGGGGSVGAVALVCHEVNMWCTSQRDDVVSGRRNIGS